MNRKILLLFLSYIFLLLPWVLLSIQYVNTKYSLFHASLSPKTMDILYYGILVAPFILGLLSICLSIIYSIIYSEYNNNSWLFYLFLIISMIGNVLSLIVILSIRSLRNSIYE